MVRAGTKGRHGRPALGGRMRVEVSWNFAEARPEFWPTLSSVTAAGPPGPAAAHPVAGHLVPDPGQYWLFGIAASYAGTFVEVAGSRSVEVRSLKVVAEGWVRPPALEEIVERPMIDQVRLTLVVDTDADEEGLSRLDSMTRNRCPGAYYLTNPVSLEVGLQQSN